MFACYLQDTPPSSDVGEINDCYLDRVSGAIYRKTKDGWKGPLVYSEVASPEPQEKSSSPSKSMTAAKINELSLKYKSFLRDMSNQSPCPMSEGDADFTFDMISDEVREGHLLFMCDMMVALMDKGKIDKAMRWLGFLQGVLWSTGYYTLNELKDHSRET